jgi:hypothetical protein
MDFSFLFHFRTLASMDSKTEQNFMFAIFRFFYFPIIVRMQRSPKTCRKRSSVLPQAGLPLHLIRAAKVDFPHYLSDEPRPRLRQTASLCAGILIISLNENMLQTVLLS